MDRRILIGGVAVGVVIVALFALFGGKKVDVQVIPGQEISAVQLYARALDSKKEGEFLKAKESYQMILTDHPDFLDIEKVQKELEELNMELIFSTTMIPDRTIAHKVQSGDTLGELAKKHGTTIDLIKRSNRLTSNVIRVGQLLRIWTGTFNIFIDKSQNLLTLRDQEDILKVYNVSTGEGNITPVGEFEIVSRLVDPVWFNKGIVVPPGSPQNVLGSRWLGFDLSGYGIHGTIDPETIGKQVTAGCVRMRNEDVEELYSIVPRGTRVIIID